MNALLRMFNLSTAMHPNPSFAGPLRKKKVVVLGGGFAGAAIVTQLKNDPRFEITLVDSKPHFENTCAFHRVLVDPSTITQNRLTPSTYAPHVKFVQDEVVGAIPGAVDLRQSGTLPYDYLVIATGTRYNSRFSSPSAIHSNNATAIVEAFPRLQEAKTVSVIGAGPVGVEVAAELCETFPDKTIVLLHPSQRVLSRMPLSAQQYAHAHLAKHSNIVFRVGSAAVSVDEHGRVLTSAGDLIPSQLAYVCTGLEPNSGFLRSNMGQILQPDGYVRVDSCLRVVGFENIFACGDITNTPEEKLATGAYSHARIVTKNIKHIEDGTSLETYQPPSITRIGLLLGRHDAMIATGSELKTGKLVAALKQQISLSALSLPSFRIAQ